MTSLSDTVLLAQLRSGAGLVAALDQSGGSTAAALRAYGLPTGSWSDDEQMFDLVHRMRVRIITTPCFDGTRILATILFRRTMEGRAEGRRVPEYLRSRGIVPILKVDEGLEPEAHGVQLMKPIPHLADLLFRAKTLGVLGTKMRSVIRRSDPAGIAALVEQQFALAEQIAAAGLLPIIEPEVSLDAPERSVAERELASQITRHLKELAGDRQVMLKLTIPQASDTYAALACHHRVTRVLALSGGLSRADACARLAYQHGMIASFSRALISDLRHDMDDATFDRALERAIDQIYVASTMKQSAE